MNIKFVDELKERKKTDVQVRTKIVELQFGLHKKVKFPNEHRKNNLIMTRLLNKRKEEESRDRRSK